MVSKNIIILAAALILSASPLYAQKFEPHNRWMTEAKIKKSKTCDYGIGVDAIYGRQFSEIIFLGVGFGANLHVGPFKRSTTIFKYNDGTEFVKIKLGRRLFIFPLYADLQVDFSRRKAPFFAELKVGANYTTELIRIRGTEHYNKMEPRMAGTYLGVGLGKHFALKNKDEISIILEAEDIGNRFIPMPEGGIGSHYTGIPVSLGIRYGF